MDLKTRKVDNVIVVYLHGKLDVHVSADVEKEINRIIEQEPQCNLLLNLGQVEYMSSSGLRIFVSTMRVLKETKRKLLEFLIQAKRAGKSVAGYGAPGKGNTLLNYCGIRTDFVDYTVDRNPYKQGKFLPGTHIPIYHPGRIKATKPDYVLILPWNFKDEIMRQIAYIQDWGGRFVVPIPEVRLYP